MSRSHAKRGFLFIFNFQILERLNLKTSTKSKKLESSSNLNSDIRSNTSPAKSIVKNCNNAYCFIKTPN